MWALLFFICITSGFQQERVFPEYSEMLTPDAGWVVTAAKEEPTMKFTVAIKQRNLEKFQRFFEKVSNPQSKIYANYLSIDEVSNMIAPAHATVKLVSSYFAKYGFEKMELSRSKDFLTVYGTPSKINAALNCDMQLWKKGEKTVWRSVVPYSFPKAIGKHIDFVSNIHHFPQEKKSVFYSPEDTPLIGPAQLRLRYNITDSADEKLNNTQAVAEFQGQYYSPSDLKQFFQQYVPNSPNDTVTGVIGPNQSGDPGVEAELDIQYIMGVNPGTKTYFYSQSSFEFWTDLTAWVTVLNNDPNPPYVHSISYGEQKEHQTSASYKTRFETEMQKMGSRGLSIIFASGDSGVGCFLCFRFEPSFPATTPSITSVGATQFMTGGKPVTSSTPEAAVSQFGSGGGMSWTFQRPSYQDAAVSDYISKHTGDIPSQFHWSKNGRATPDVAALGIGFSVVVNGGVESIGGTSAAAPTFSAVIATLNDQQLKAGKKPLGFLNPWLYQTWAKASNAFYDVTEGSNPDSCCVTGFKCAPGWDAVTGLGTPNYEVMKQYLP